MDTDKTKVVKVVAAVICRDGKVFATQRGYGKYKDKWEFPGGKIEENETPEDALVREILEELNADIKVGEILTIVEYDYPDFHLSMACYSAEVTDGSDLQLLEHEAARWLGADELYSVDWLPADIEVLRVLQGRTDIL